MAQANPQDSPGIQETLERSREHIGPSLGIESSGNGYIRAEELEDSSGLFSGHTYKLEEYDSSTSENIFIDSVSSAKVLEHYFGQHSRTDETLAEFLESFDEALPDLDNNIVLDLDLYSYGGKQHVKYSEGEVARELIEYLDSESSWSSRTYFIEEKDRLFIQSSP